MASTCSSCPRSGQCWQGRHCHLEAMRHPLPHPTDSHVLHSTFNASTVEQYIKVKAARHRAVTEAKRTAKPACAIGLVSWVRKVVSR